MNLEQEIKNKLNEGKIIVNKHEKHDLYIYNYSRTVQFNREWDETTLMCRGLILDGNYNIVARPFKKFFNLEEHNESELPNEEYEVYKKMDGSLGIMYFVEDKPYIATRGSFHSDQANKANEILVEKYSHLFDKLNRNYTYLFEIIYPENQIVVNYNGKEDLVLLAIIDTETGKDIELQNIGFPIVESYNSLSFSELKSLNKDNEEGYIIKYKSGFRIKIKFEDYIRLHSIITDCSNVKIWEYLKLGQDLNELIENVPDEFYDWVTIEINNLLLSYTAIETSYIKAFRLIKCDSRKDYAQAYQKYKYSSILFSMLDEKPYSDIIWKAIKPTFKKPFEL